MGLWAQGLYEIFLLTSKVVHANTKYMCFFKELGRRDADYIKRMSPNWVKTTKYNRETRPHQIHKLVLLNTHRKISIMNSNKIDWTLVKKWDYALKNPQAKGCKADLSVNPQIGWLQKRLMLMLICCERKYYYFAETVGLISSSEQGLQISITRKKKSICNFAAANDLRSKANGC